MPAHCNVISLLIYFSFKGQLYLDISRNFQKVVEKFSAGGGSIPGASMGFLLSKTRFDFELFSCSSEGIKITSSYLAKNAIMFPSSKKQFFSLKPSLHVQILISSWSVNPKPTKRPWLLWRPCLTLSILLNYFHTRTFSLKDY